MLDLDYQITTFFSFLACFLGLRLSSWRRIYPQMSKWLSVNLTPFRPARDRALKFPNGKGVSRAIRISQNVQEFYLC